MASGGVNPTGQSDNFRRTWDLATYEKLAKERLVKDRDGSKNKKNDDKAGDDTIKEMLKYRDYKVDLDSKLGKTLVINKTTPQSQSGGYYCNVCDCLVKDSINFLDHINGRKHQRNLGMSMKVERSSLEDIKGRFQQVKKKKSEEKKQYDFEQRMRELQEEEAKVKEYRKEKRKERKRRARGEPEGDDEGDEGLDPELAAMMGFSGFSSGSGNSKRTK